MSLPLPSVPREPLHTRSIQVRTYARDDGLYDLEAELIDLKAYDFPTRKGVKRAGDAVHHMHVRVTINDGFDIVDAMAVYAAAPYDEHCSAIAPAYGDLVGMNLLRGFRGSVKARFGRTAGCIHMSELAAVLPTVAVQTLGGRHRDLPVDAESTTRPFQLDGCHALRVDGAVVKRDYPRWYAAPAEDAWRSDAEPASALTGASSPSSSSSDS